MTPALSIIAPGLMTTVQDLGRSGYQSLGIPMSGAIDPVSLRAANLLAGNAIGSTTNPGPGIAALEIAYQGPTLKVEAERVRVALAGASATIDVLPADPEFPPRRAAPLESLSLTRGETLRIGPLSGSAIAYLAVEGGFDIPPVLGSRSTLTRAALGGFGGRPLRAGDRLPLALAASPEREEQMLPALDLTPPPRFRVVLGPQDDYFSVAGLATLLDSTYVVSRASDRMGMRLEGPALEHARGYNIVSDGIAPGSIQVPGNGLPIILLADRQTTGGYPKIATVISADLPALGRLAPGAKVTFQAVSIEEAEASRREQAAMINSLAQRLVPARRMMELDAVRLLQENLVSGMVDAHE